MWLLKAASRLPYSNARFGCQKPAELAAIKTLAIGYFCIERINFLWETSRQGQEPSNWALLAKLVSQSFAVGAGCLQNWLVSATEALQADRATAPLSPSRSAPSAPAADAEATGQ